MSPNKSTELLTEKKFWERDWEEINFPGTLNRRLRGDRAFINLYEKYLSKNDSESKKSIEIGCNPGKFLIYCGKNLNYDISGLDYDEKGCFFSLKNIKAAGLEGSIINEDFFKYKFNTKFDLVLSHGFIEHFKDDKLLEALNTHVNILNYDGILFISVPNFRYLNFLLTYLFRKKLLDHHNLETMQKKFFKEIAKKYNLNIEYLGYFGGIHPGGLKIESNHFLSKITKSIESFQFLDNLNSKYFSHHIGSIFSKK